MNKDFDKAYADAERAMTDILMHMANAACDRHDPATVYFLVGEHRRIMGLERRLRLYGCLKG